MQCVGKRDFWPGDEAFWPAATQYYNAQTWHVYDSWTPENPGAYLPIARATDSRNRGVYTDRYLQNASYCRMKNITLGYTVPKTFTNKIGISGLRFYAAVNDLFSISNFPNGWDPEMTNFAYPITTSFIFGASINF